MDYDHHTFAGRVILVIGYILGAASAAPVLDFWLGVGVKACSITSFLVFIFLNWPKIKKRINEIFEK